MKLKLLHLITLSIILTIPAIGFSGIIFEDDFSNDGGWVGTDTGHAWKETGQPSKWDSYKITTGNGSYMAIVPNQGQNGTPVLKIGYMITQGQASAIGLGKHLTGNRNTGYSELYIRYKVKFDDNWISGDGQQNYWKWFRLHQYRPTSNINSYGENDGVGDTRYIVGVWASNPPTFEVMASSNINDTSGSAGGPHIGVGYSGTSTCSTCGHFESMPGWDFDSSGYWTKNPQTWHTVEFHIKLNSGGDCDGTENGVLEMWLDGTKQLSNQYYSKRNGETKTCSALHTQKYQGGINYLKVFDNLADWTKSWGSTQRYVSLDNLVVSTSYIGPSYVISGSTPPQDTMPPASPLSLR